MLRIRVTQVDGLPPTMQLSCELDQCSGTIGRDEGNVLILPDPHRHISRMQAELRYDGTRYLLVDHGGNPTLHNGRPLGKGQSATLSDGDEINIVEYQLRVELIHKNAPLAEAPPLPIPTPAAPANDLLGLGLAAPAPASVKDKSLLDNPYNDDPFAVFTPPVPPPNDPFIPPPNDPFAPPPSDPFAPPPVAAQPAPLTVPAQSTTDPLGIGDLARPTTDSSLDALFNLTSATHPHDPLAGSPLDDTGHTPAPSTGSSADPLSLLGALAATADNTPQRDDKSLLRDAFPPPRIIEDPPRIVEEPPPPPAPTPAPASEPMHAPARTLTHIPKGGVVSWAAPPAAAPEEVPPQPARETEVPKEAPTPAAPRINVSVDPPKLETPPPAPSPAPAAAAGSAAPLNADLLNAFARGIGLSKFNPPDGMTPELMEHIGRMLREAVKGTLELLIARAATKREVRADITMIVSKYNNPLKFSPDVDFALTQLLLPQSTSTGFMKPDEAMRDAYDDLRAHQLGFVVGMQAALASVLKRFTPDELEARLTNRSLLDSVLPGNRKAKLWDLFEQRYNDISREAEDDFHSLFGREFLKAYAAQIEQIQGK